MAKKEEKKVEINEPLNVLVSRYNKSRFLLSAENLGYSPMIVKAAFNEYDDEQEFSKDEGIKIIEKFLKKPIK